MTDDVESEGLFVTSMARVQGFLEASGEWTVRTVMSGMYAEARASDAFVQDYGQAGVVQHMEPVLIDQVLHRLVEEVGAARMQRAVNAAASRETQEARAALERDALRYRWLRETLHGAKAGGGVEVNQKRQLYDQPKPGEEVRVYWYQNTPVVFDVVESSTLDEAIDMAMRGEVES